MSEEKGYRLLLTLGWTFALAAIIFLFLDSSRENILLFAIFLLIYFLMDYALGSPYPRSGKPSRSDLISGYLIIVSLLAYYGAGYMLFQESLKNNPIALLIYGTPFLVLELVVIFFWRRSKEQTLGGLYYE